jgi:putative ABC transport system substrate-binding protein
MHFGAIHLNGVPMKKRATLLALLALGAAPFAGLAQQPGKVWRIGYLALNPGPDESSKALVEQLRSLGYDENRNLAIEYRWAAGREDRAQEMAAELARIKVDAIVTRSTFITAAARRATSTIPIIMANSADPVGSGIIASLTHPGGNITGMSQNSNEIAGKRLQLLHELLPKATRIAVLAWEQSPLRAQFLEQIRAAARQMGITLVIQEAGSPESLTPAFGAMQRLRAQGLLVQNTPFTSNNRKRIVELATQYRLPTIFEGRSSVEDGGLMSYGTSVTDMHRRAAFYVDKVLKGARPADLPVEQPTSFEMFINLKTARAIGIQVPKAVLMRANEVIQ